MKHRHVSARWVVATLAAVVVAGLVVATPAVAREASPSGGYVPTISWKKCSDKELTSRGLQCADVKVPLDHAKPNGTKITIAISRLRHTVARSKYQGSMFVNPGGPGGSGLQFALVGGSSALPKNVRGAYDWIGFDPRGVGASRPAVSCDPEYAGYDRPPYVPSTPAIEQAWKDKSNAYTRACAEKNGPILDHLTTRDVAKDIDLIRKSLGQGRINYYGYSYGTYIGQVYSSLFPSRVRRMVFDGTVDPRGVWYDANLEQDKAFDRNINIFFRWVAKHDSAYHLGRTTAAVRTKYYDTLKRLDETAVQAKGGKLGGSEWTDSLLQAGYAEFLWPETATTFAAFVNDGDVDALEQAYLSAGGYGDDNGYAVYLGVQCTDTTWPISWRKWARDNDAIYAKAPFQTWGNAWYNEPCRHWPAPFQRPVRVKGAKSVDVLMLNESLDAATPYPGSIEVRRRYPGARLVATVGGTTHSNSLAGNACVDKRIASYLATGALPRRAKGNRADIRCAPLPQPEPETASLRSQRTQQSSVDSVLEQLRRRSIPRA